MKSIDKLRTAARNMAKGRELENHEECNLLLVIADEIEADIADRYMLLPVGADGVPIHIGDTVEGELLFDNATVKGTVTTYHIHDNDEPDTVYIKVDCGNGTWTIKELRIERCRHVKPDPLKELLHDACMNATRICCEQGVGTNVHVEIDETGLAEYAERIRELMGGDA